jgi:uncharacterized protein
MKSTWRFVWILSKAVGSPLEEAGIECAAIPRQGLGSHLGLNCGRRRPCGPNLKSDSRRLRGCLAVRGGPRSRNQSFVVNANQLFSAESDTGIIRPSVFGSVVHGTDRDGSDLDLLVDALPGATLFDLGGLQAKLEELLGVSVDLVTPGHLPPKFRQRVLAEALPRMSDNGLPEYLDQIRQAETNSCNSVTRIIKAQCDRENLERQHRAEVPIAVADLRSNLPAGFISALAGL